MNIAKWLKGLLIDQFTLYGGGGKGGGGDAPDPPDPYAVAGATTQTNKDTAAYNKALNLNNYSNPFGSQQSAQIGVDPQSGAPIYNTSISANPQLQQALSSLLGQTGNSAQVNAYAQSGLQGVAAGYGGLNGALSGVGSQISGLNSGLSGLGAQYNDLTSGLSGLNSAYGSLNNNISGLNNQYSGLNSRLGQLGSQMSMDQVKQAQQKGQDAAYAAQTQYLDPQFSQEQTSLSSQLANQGLTPGSQAYNNAMLNFNNQKQQAYSNAQNQAIMTGSQVGAQNLQNQLAGINTQAGLIGQEGQNLGAQAGLYGQQGQNLGAQAGIYGQQAQNVGAQAGLYGQQGANLGALAGIYGQQGQNLGAQAGAYGQFANIGQLPYSNLQSIAGLIPGYAGPAQSSTSPANIGQNVYSNYQAQMNNYNAQTQSANQFTGGLFGLGSAGLLAYGMSDRRIKRDVRRIGTLRNGLPWYSFRYRWSDKLEEGVMSDDVRKLMPQAVAVHASGFDMVDYAQVM
jgi:hypothetical protein